MSKNQGSTATWRTLGAGGMLAIALGVAGCGQPEASVRGPKPVEVSATRPVADDVVDYQDFTGRLNAIKTVEVRARVTGYVKDATFKEGDLVRENDVLFEIDQRSYDADYKQALANVKVAEAERTVHEKNAHRARQLSASKAISVEEYDLAIATVEKDIASVEAKKAMVDRSKLYLDWTHVVAPLSGRVSRRLIDPGNLITADQTILTTIVSEDPAYVYFDVDERTFLDLTKSASPSVSGVTGLQFPVLMRLANEDEYNHQGAVNFIDNQVSASTGTIRMRGVFANPDGRLKSGLFARIRLPIGVPFHTLLIPDEAIMSDQGRKYVYVVNGKKEIVYHKVTLGQAIHGLRVIKEGVAAGDAVVVTGMQRVRPGAQVEVKMLPTPTRPESPLGKLMTVLKPAPPKQGAVGTQ